MSGTCVRVAQVPDVHIQGGIPPLAVQDWLNSDRVMVEWYSPAATSAGVRRARSALTCEVPISSAELAEETSSSWPFRPTSGAPVPSETTLETGSPAATAPVEESLIRCGFQPRYSGPMVLAGSSAATN